MACAMSTTLNAWQGDAVMPARITVEKSGARKVNLKMLLESKAAQNQLKQIAKMQTKQSECLRLSALGKTVP